MSLHDLRYIPTIQAPQSQDTHQKGNIVSLRTLDNLPSDQLIQNENHD